MELDRLIILCYEYFIKSSSTNPEYSFSLTAAKTKTISRFIDMVKDQYGDSFIGIGHGWIFNYTLFQINRYYDSLEFDNRDVFSWFYGPKAFDRWVNKAPGWRYGIAHGLQSKFKFTEKDVIDYMGGNISSDLDVVMKSYEDSTRKKKDFAQCILRTTLYHPMTRSCRTCPAKKDCKDLLKIRHPQIFIKRCQ